MKKVILAFDTFKGSAHSIDIAQATARAVSKQFPACEIVSFPIADGGEGSTAAICSALQVEYTNCLVHDALMNPIEVSYAITQDGTTAILEMASCCGLPLIAPDKRNPLLTTTFGVGELVNDALRKGCRSFIMGIGGSATNDAGIGMMAALGIRFLNEDGEELIPCGESLSKIHHIDESQLNPLLKETHFTIICDVNNPFCGINGAAYVYAPQKGATPQMVRELDHGLCHYAQILYQQKQMDITHLQGAGAAGGMGGGLLPFLHAVLKPGIETILDILHFRESLIGADLVLTGEGKLDAQTTMGKALGGILEIANKEQIPVVALGGTIESVSQLNELGFTAVFSIQQGPISLEDAMKQDTALTNIETTITQILRLIKRFES